MDATTNTLRAVAAHLAAPANSAVTPAASAASANGVTELPPIGLHGPLPDPPARKFLRPREEWGGLAEADATTWFTNHRGKPGLPLLEDDYLFQDPDHPCLVPCKHYHAPRPAAAPRPHNLFGRPCLRLGQALTTAQAQAQAQGSSLWDAPD